MIAHGLTDGLRRHAPGETLAHKIHCLRSTKRYHSTCRASMCSLGTSVCSSSAGRPVVDLGLVLREEEYLLVAQHVPDAIAGEDEELVALFQLEMPDLWNCYDHLHMQLGLACRLSQTCACSLQVLDF